MARPRVGSIDDPEAQDQPPQGERQQTRGRQRRREGKSEDSHGRSQKNERGSPHAMDDEGGTRGPSSRPQAPIPFPLRWCRSAQIASDRVGRAREELRGLTMMPRMKD